MADRIDYRAVVADLKARRSRLDNLIVEYESLIVGKGSGGSPEGLTSQSSEASLPDIHADTFFGLGIKEASTKYLKMAGRAQHTRTIAEALAQGGMKRPADNSLFSILVRAAKGREVVKVGKGMWGLAEWYPKRPKTEPPGIAKRRRKIVARKPLALPAFKPETKKRPEVGKKADAAT